MLIIISKKTPFLLIKKALLLIGEFKPEKTLLIVRAALTPPICVNGEMVDTPVSGTGARKGMGVRVSRRVPYAQVPERVYESVSKTDAERYAS